MSASFYDLLKYAKTGIAAPDMTAYDKLKALAMCKAGFPVKTLTGVPPISFQSDGSALTAWSIYGNMTQTGTQTPSAPITPDECGDRTGNLVPEIRSANGWVIGYRNSSNGLYISNNRYGERLSPKIQISAGDAFTISAMQITPESMSVYFWNGDTYLSNASKTDYSGSTFTAPEGTTQIDFAIRAGSDKKTEAAIISSGFWVMLNTGSTALPYEPYGYKIPLTCAGQTVPVYLGEVPTVRRIKKVVFTGQETWTEVYPGEPEAQAQGIVMYATSLSEIGTDRNDFRCSHFFVGNYRGYLISGQGRINGTYTSAVPEAFTVNYNNGSGGLQDFKAWLASEYAAGHPVTLWYVLATEQTGIVNEPLCKISTYADELRSGDAAVTIPTVKGQNTLTIGTTLQPSEISITGGIK